MNMTMALAPCLGTLIHSKPLLLSHCLPSSLSLTTFARLPHGNVQQTAIVVAAQR